MPQSFLVFVVSFTPETPNFGTYRGVVHPPPLKNLLFLKKILLFMCVFAHILNLNYEKKIDI